MRKNDFILLGLCILGLACLILWYLNKKAQEKGKSLEQQLKDVVYGSVITEDVKKAIEEGKLSYSKLVEIAESKFLVEKARKLPIEQYAIDAYEARIPYVSMQEEAILTRVMAMPVTPTRTMLISPTRTLETAKAISTEAYRSLAEQYAGQPLQAYKTPTKTVRLITPTKTVETAKAISTEAYRSLAEQYAGQPLRPAPLSSEAVRRLVRV